MLRQSNTKQPEQHKTHKANQHEEQSSCIDKQKLCNKRTTSVSKPTQPCNMFFYDGCALVGDENSPYETIATYSNGDNMAIIQNRIGLIGCHPESEQFWYDGYSWLKGKYHNGTQHELLLNFVNELMQR